MDEDIASLLKQIIVARAAAAAEDRQLIRKRDAEESKRPRLLNLEEGKTYVTRLPGHARPCFIRKSRKIIELPSIASVFSIKRPADKDKAKVKARATVPEKPVEREVQYITPPPQPAVPMVAPPPHLAPPMLPLQDGGQSHRFVFDQQGRPFYIIGDPQFLHPQPVSTEVQPASGLNQAPISDQYKREEKKESTPETTSIHNLLHRCALCQKWRSPAYHARHPPVPGEKPKFTLCRRCQKTETSSESSSDSEPRQSHQRKKKGKKQKKKHQSRRKKGHSSSNLQSPSSSSTELSHVRRRHKPRSESSTQHRHRKEPSEPDYQSLVSEQSRRPESIIRNSRDSKVRVIQRIKYIEREPETPQQQPETHSSLIRTRNMINDSLPSQRGGRKYKPIHEPAERALSQYTNTTKYTYDDTAARHERIRRTRSDDGPRNSHAYWPQQRVEEHYEDNEPDRKSHRRLPSRSVRVVDPAEIHREGGLFGRRQEARHRSPSPLDLGEPCYFSDDTAGYVFEEPPAPASSRSRQSSDRANERHRDDLRFDQQEHEPPSPPSPHPAYDEFVSYRRVRPRRASTFRRFPPLSSSLEVLGVSEGDEGPRYDW